MIYLLYGADTDRARMKLHDLVASLLKKKPDASHLSITDETFDEALLEEYLSSFGLFENKSIIECLTLFRNKTAKEVVLSKIKEIAESPNIFVFLEGELNKTDLAKFEKSAEKVQVFGKPHAASAEALRGKDFKIFALADAFGRRDRKQLWVLLTKAKMKEISAEEIHGILFWQVKAILQALAARDAKSAGLNPYVYQKSTGFAHNFADGELKHISSKLVSMYHDARRGIIDFDAALEKFILEV